MGDGEMEEKFRREQKKCIEKRERRRKERGREGEDRYGGILMLIAIRENRNLAKTHTNYNVFLVITVSALHYQESLSCPFFKIYVDRIFSVLFLFMFKLIFSN